MKTKQIILLLALGILFKNLTAQSLIDKAHFRSYRASVLLQGDLRTPKFMLTPKASILLLDGLIELNGLYAVQIGRNRDEHNSPIKSETLVGSNLTRKFKSYDVQLGTNIYKRYNDNALVNLFRRGRYIYYGPGSRANMYGMHVGAGGFITRLDGYRGDEGLFLLQSSNGSIISNSKKPGSMYTYSMYTNSITEYMYAGIHWHLSSKGKMFYHQGRGGGVSKVSLDYIMPYRVEAGTMYSDVGDSYTIAKQPNSLWRNNGYRVVLEATGTSLTHWLVRIEGGRMPTFSTWTVGSKAVYIAASVGITISPKIGVVKFNRYKPQKQSSKQGADDSDLESD